MRTQFSDDEITATRSAIRLATFQTTSLSGIHCELDILRQDGIEARKRAEAKLPVNVRSCRLIATQETGKSTALRSYVGCRENGGLGSNGALYVPLPANCSPQPISSEILRLVGAHHAGRQSRKHGIVQRVVDALSHSNPQVNLLILDNTHNCFDRDTGEPSLRATGYIRSLIDAVGIPVVISGSDNLVNILKADKDLSAKTKIRLTMDPMTLDTKEGVDQFIMVVNGYRDLLPALSDPSDLTSPDTLLKLHTATGGLIGNVASLFAEAATIAMRREAGPLAITGQDFAKAFDRCLDAVVNPFIDDHGVSPMYDQDNAQQAKQRSIRSA